jgi:hypothetical protein
MICRVRTAEPRLCPGFAKENSKESNLDFNSPPTLSSGGQEESGEVERDGNHLRLTGEN